MKGWAYGVCLMSIDLVLPAIGLGFGLGFEIRVVIYPRVTLIGVRFGLG